MSWWFQIDLWKRVILALVVGLAVGLGLRYGMGAEAGGAFAEDYIAWIGDLFLRLIRMLIVPLVFFTLVSGIIAMGDPKRLGSLGVRTLGTYFGTTAIAVTLGLTFAVLALLLFAAGIHFALRFAQHPQIVLGMLLKVLGGHAVTGQLGVARQLVVLVDDLLRRAAHLALGAGTVEHPVDDVTAATAGIAIAAALGPGP